MSGYSAAQEKSIQSIRPAVKDGNLITSVHFQPGFFTEDMLQSISSGLSTSLNFSFNLQSADNKIIRTAAYEIVLKYDVWEKQYLLSGREGTHPFAELSRFKNFLLDSLQFNLGSVSTMDAQKPFSIVLLYSPEKISPAQQAKINNWLTGHSDSRENTPGIDGESGFSINITGLFSFFLGRKAESRVQQYNAGPYTIENLKINEITAQ